MSGTIAASDQRFWSRVVQDGDDNLASCWNWTGYIAKTGYGHMRRKAGAWLCHRYAYTALRGDIPTGLHLDHLCRNTRCVNPWHLEPVSPAVNAQRALAVRQPAPLRTHCVKGLHPFDTDNTVYQGAHRRCRTCLNAASLASYHRRKAVAA